MCNWGRVQITHSGAGCARRCPEGGKTGVLPPSLLWRRYGRRRCSVWQFAPAHPPRTSVCVICTRPQLHIVAAGGGFLELRREKSCSVYKCVYTVLIEYIQYARSGRTMTSGATLAPRGRPRRRRERDSDSWKSSFRIRATSPFMSRSSDRSRVRSWLVT